MQYTGYTAVSDKDSPTCACVGANDGIANWHTMQSRLAGLEALGIPTEFRAYEGLGHGFGLGTGTAAEGWIKDAVNFWEAHTDGSSFPDVSPTAWYVGAALLDRPNRRLSKAGVFGWFFIQTI